MSNLTPPTDYLNFIIGGDLDVISPPSVDNGNGSVYIRNGGLYVDGLTDLDQTTITTGDGEFNVSGPNKVSFGISGGATSAIEFTAEDASFFTTTAGIMTLSSTATDANGKILVEAAGLGDDSVKISATNATSGQITVTSAGASTTSDAVRILATDTVEGNVRIVGSGSFDSSVPAVSISANNSTSGQISIVSLGDSITSDGVLISSSGTTGGNVNIIGAGSTDPAVSISATNAAGQVLVSSSGVAADSVKVISAGGVDIGAANLVSVQTTDATNGITIGTVNAGIPVFIGGSTSLTTISGDLIIEGGFTAINTESLTVEDNVIVLNSGNGELGIDAGIVLRRHQTANDAGTGDVVTNPNPVQESGAFIAGSVGPGTLVLSPFASDTDDFYKGWWIKVTSGTGALQVRRIASYVGSTKTATIYVTADNTNLFLDGLDLTIAPAAAATYRLYSAPFVSHFYSESQDSITLATLANAPDAIGAAGISTGTVQQYQDSRTGAQHIHQKVYRNAKVTATGTDGIITISVIGHQEIIGNTVRLRDSSDITPVVVNAGYLVTSVAADSFTVDTGVTTSSVATSSITYESMHSSVLYVNVIKNFDPDFPGITVDGFTTIEDIIIPQASTAQFIVSASKIQGAYIMFVSNINETTIGSFGVFSLASSGSGGSVSRLSGSKGADNERIDAGWNSAQGLHIRQKPANNGGTGNYTYRVRLITSY